MSDFQDCIVSYLDLNDVERILSRQSRHAVRMMRDLHALLANYAGSLWAHAEICFWQDSVLLLGFVDETSDSYRRVMSDVVRLKEVIHRMHPCHGVCVKGQSFPAQQIPPRANGPRVVYLSASSLAFSNAFQIERELHQRGVDWYIDSRIVKRCKFRAADACKHVKLLPTNAGRKIHLYCGSPKNES
jgi:hypothetical protein